MSLRLKWAIIVGIFLALGGTALIVGFKCAGYDILAWFSSKYAIYVYIMILFYLLFLGWFFVYDYIVK